MSQTKSKKEKSMAEMAIEINDLTKKYGDLVAVNNLSLKIRRGEILGLLGPNGAGKTTTINMLNGLLKPTEGEIFVNGYNIKKDLKKIKNLIGVCPQHEAVYKFLTGRENIELFGILYDLKKQEIKERTDFLLKSINFVEESKRKAKTYSGGMLRILNMLMALIGNPEIIFLDEPTVGMDPRQRLSNQVKEKVTRFITTPPIKFSPSNGHPTKKFKYNSINRRSKIKPQRYQLSPNKFLKMTHSKYAAACSTT
ncbi:MAG: ATP-binding cassette domain-containing protein [Candidatus Lokiarchaeota archaeon]|nr:ATP-binding cassette domain-containing protein [Candidatus Lokiarchaeota archaeon]